MTDGEEQYRKEKPPVGNARRCEKIKISNRQSLPSERSLKCLKTLAHVQV